MTVLWPHFKGNVCVPFNFLVTKKKKMLSLQKVVNILECLLIMKSCTLKFVQGEGNLIFSKLPLFEMRRPRVSTPACHAWLHVSCWVKMMFLTQPGSLPHLHYVSGCPFEEHQILISSLLALHGFAKQRARPMPAPVTGPSRDSPARLLHPPGLQTH